MANNVQSFLLGNRGELNPEQGFRCSSPVSVPNTGNAFPIDLSSEQQTTNFMAGALAIYVNNGARSNPLIIVFSTGMRITFPANSQGYVNILQTNPIQVFATNSSPEGAVEIMFINVQMSTLIWAVTVTH